ncbi:MAG: class I SAM-dependent methyltransferase [Methanospirillum sp.]|nr:class I SAM-dependent methyltransferase [Methanospirillum sp.]
MKNCMELNNKPLPDIKENIRTYWNERSITFDQDVGHGADETECRLWKKYLGDIIGSGKKTILDVGTGTGMIALNLAELGHTVTGIDLGEKMLEIARQKAARKNLSLDFRLGDAEDLPFPADSFDCVICRHLLWTLPHPEQAIREWSRVSTPGGLIIAIDGHAKPRNYFPEPEKDHPGSEREMLWHRMYSREIITRLPYRENLTIDTILALFSSENLSGVQSLYLDEITEYQKSLQKGEPGDDQSEVHIIWGRSPGNHPG